MSRNVADILFTDAIRYTQKSLGTREQMIRLESRNHWVSDLSGNQMDFISTAQSFYLGTSSKKGEPYIQHRGGPAGFVKVENKSTLWFPDFSGNRQYITVGNLSENSSCFIFIMDYQNRRRLKLWGEASVFDAQQYSDKSSVKSEGRMRIERLIKFNIHAIDENCRNHIKPACCETEYLQKLDESEVKIQQLQARINYLEQEIKECLYG